MTILKQELIRENDKKGTVRLRNTIDCSAAIEMARITNTCNEGGNFGSKNDGCRVMGYIPPEMWQFDPWLIMARRAEREGDRGQYQKHLTKFFDVHKDFKVNRKRKYWRGSMAVVL